jgi:hypothetical protein
MADQEVISIPLTMPPAEATALAQLCKRMTFETIVDHACVFDRGAYAGRAECDVMWSSVNQLRGALASAGFAPR